MNYMLIISTCFYTTSNVCIKQQIRPITLEVRCSNLADLSLRMMLQTAHASDLQESSTRAHES